MATRNFHLMRDTNLVREGRFRAPAAADLRLGTLVEMDETAGELDHVEAAATTVTTGVAGRYLGILWYEHDAATLEGEPLILPIDRDEAPRDRLVQMLYGKGAKVRLINTAANEVSPGLHFPNSRPAVAMIASLSTVAQGDLLAWNGTQYVETAVPGEAVLQVTFVSAGATNLSGYVEAVLLI